MTDVADRVPEAQPCSVCAALVPVEHMEAHLAWHDTLTGGGGHATAEVTGTGSTSVP
jgi:hypothetical protein